MEGYKGLIGLGRENPCKKNGGKQQKIWLKPWPRRKEREGFENFLKSKFGHMKIRFEKLFIRFSIDRKLDSIDQKCFDGTNINQASIETDRGWPKFLIAILIDRKRILIDPNFGKNNFRKKNKLVYCRNSSMHWKNKMHEYEMKCFSKTQVLNPVFPKFQIFNPFY